MSETATVTLVDVIRQVCADIDSHRAAVERHEDAIKELQAQLAEARQVLHLLALPPVPPPVVLHSEALLEDAAKAGSEMLARRRVAQTPPGPPPESGDGRFAELDAGILAVLTPGRWLTCLELAEATSGTAARDIARVGHALRRLREAGTVIADEGSGPRRWARVGTPAPKRPPAESPPAPPPRPRSPFGPAQSGTYQPERDARILAALLAGPLTATEVTRQVDDTRTPSKGQIGNIWRALQRLQRDGHLTRDDDARYHLRETAGIAIRKYPDVVAAQAVAVDDRAVSDEGPDIVPVVEDTPSPRRQVRNPGTPWRQGTRIEPPQVETVKAGSPTAWWAKAPREGFTSAAEQERERMAQSREAHKVPSDRIVE